MVPYKTGKPGMEAYKTKKENPLIHGRLSKFARRAHNYVVTLNIPIKHAYSRSLVNEIHFTCAL